MSDMSPDLKQLVMAGKNASRPTEADSARVFEALRVRLGDAALLGAATGQAAAGSSPGFLFSKLAGIGIAGLAVVGGLWFFAARTQRVVSSEPHAVPSAAAPKSAEPSLVAVTIASSAPALPELDPAVSSSGKADRSDVRAVAPHHARDNLSEEVAILSRAETELHGGKPEAALRLLNEHERKFGNGLLAEERIAARVQALCALGRTAEADAQLARLSPKSLHGEQARQACKGN